MYEETPPLDAQDIFEELSVVKDPERPETLAELGVFYPAGVVVTPLGRRRFRVHVTIVPTVPHCHLVWLIALATRVRLSEALPLVGGVRWVVIIDVPDGAHVEAKEVRRRSNDKERVAAALENEQLRGEVRRIIGDI